MVQGRTPDLQRLYDLKEGEAVIMFPASGVTVDLLAKRLRQVVTRYLREGKAYRLTVNTDHVVASRVAVGSHHKLSHLRDLKTGERYYVADELTWKQRKALLAQLDRLNYAFRYGGFWRAEVESDGIYVRRLSTRGEALSWYEMPGNKEGRGLSLARD